MTTALEDEPMANLTPIERNALLEMILVRLGKSGNAHPSLEMCAALVSKGMLEPDTLLFTWRARALVRLGDEAEADNREL